MVDLGAERPALGSVWRRKRDGIKVRIHYFQLWYVYVQRLPKQRKTRTTGGKLVGARDGKSWPVRLTNFHKLYEPLEAE